MQLFSHIDNRSGLEYTVSTSVITRHPVSTETINYRLASHARLLVPHMKDLTVVNGDYNAHTRILTLNLADGRQIAFERYKKDKPCYHHLAVCNILTESGVFASLDEAKMATFGAWTLEGEYTSLSFYFTVTEASAEVVRIEYM